MTPTQKSAEDIAPYLKTVSDIVFKCSEYGDGQYVATETQFELAKAIRDAEKRGMLRAAEIQEAYARKFMLCDASCKGSKEIRAAAEKDIP